MRTPETLRAARSRLLASGVVEPLQILITGTATVISVLSGVVALLYRERTQDLTARVKALEAEVTVERAARMSTAEGYTAFALRLQDRTGEQVKHLATVADAVKMRDAAALAEAVARGVADGIDRARDDLVEAVAKRVRRSGG